MSESPDKRDTPVAGAKTPVEGEGIVTEEKSEAASPEHQQDVTPAEEKEKEKASSRKGSVKASSPSRASGKGDASKPGTAKSGKKSGPVSAKSEASGKRSKSPGKEKSGKKKERASAKSELEEKESSSPVPEPIKGRFVELPENCEPLFLSHATQELFHCITDKDVTLENPYILLKKDDILQDIYNRAAVSDFQPFNQKITDYEGEEILFYYDRDYTFGQNFFVAWTEEIKNFILTPPTEAEGEEVEEEIPKYVPPISKPWISQGSEKEIHDGHTVLNRTLLRVTLERAHKEFGAPVELSDRVDKEKRPAFDYVECAPFEEKSFDLKRQEIDKGIQAVPEKQENYAQTAWPYPKNAAVQYVPREMEEKEREEIFNSKEMFDVIEKCLPRFHVALQQNEIIDVFYDDWAELAGDDSALGSKADNHLKEYQSFTDLQFSKEKSISCIQWHPTIRGIIAVSITERVSFDERVDQSAKILMTPSLILIWSFHDPIRPQLVLEAPDDIVVFKFNPSDPNIVAGGCVNGQLVLWDITNYSQRLKTQRTQKKKNFNTAFEEESPDHIKVRYCAVSSIEHSHKGPITDLKWVPGHMEINRLGVPLENKENSCVQLMTCSVDHVVLFWDTRPPKTVQHQQLMEKLTKEPNPMNIPITFRHLDLAWKPLLRVTLPKSEPGGDHSPTKFSIAEKHGDKKILEDLDQIEREKEKAAGFSGLSNPIKPTSGHKRALTMMNTHFYVGTEDGELVYVDWMPQKDQDTGKIQTPKADYYHSLHAGPVVTLSRNPFFKDVILCVGGWNFTIWKEGVSSGPIVQSSASKRRLKVAHWSPSRPSVFYVGRDDGSIDVWDLLDRTHEPSLTQSISTSPITAIYPHRVTPRQQLIAVSDASGTLHILEVPASLRNPADKEGKAFANYVEREVNRRAFVVDRWDFRESEKRQMESEAKLKAGIAPQHQLTDEEVLYRQKQEYQAFLEAEHNFLRELGLIKEEEEELPVVD